MKKIIKQTVILMLLAMCIIGISGCTKVEADKKDEEEQYIVIDIADNKELKAYIENSISDIVECKVIGNIKCTDDSNVDNIIKTGRGNEKIGLVTYKPDDMHDWLSNQKILKTKLTSIGLTGTVYVYFKDNLNNKYELDENNYSDKIVLGFSN